MKILPGHILVCQIAAPISCHTDFASWLLILFQDRDGGSVSGCHDSTAVSPDAPPPTTITCGFLSINNSFSEKNAVPALFLQAELPDFSLPVSEATSEHPVWHVQR